MFSGIAKEHRMDWRPHISQDPAVLRGKPCIKGTRISVELIVEDMADGATIDVILSSYPFLARDQVRAALAYAAASLSSELMINAETANS